MSDIHLNSSDLKAVELAGMIDHTKLGADTTIKDITVLCQEAATYNFASVCVPPCYVKEANLMLREKSPAICTVLGFPHGNSCSAAKAKEASLAIERGATEVDMVIAVGLLKSGLYKEVGKDIEEVVRICKDTALVKVILECVLLTDEEKRTACRLARDAGADFVKTSTGFAGGGATEKDIVLMHDTVGSTLGIKASGGIRTNTEAMKMVRAGATRIGASASVAIIQAMKNVSI